MIPPLYPQTAQALGLLRIWVFGLWLLHVLLDPLTELAEFPSDMYHAPGLVGWLPEALQASLLSHGGLLATKALLIVLLGSATLGVLTRPCALAGSILLVYYQGLVRGFGHVNHGEMTLIYAAFLLALVPCGDALALRPSRTERRPGAYSSAFLLIALALCFTYFLVGLNRILHHADVFGDGAMSFWMQLAAYRDSADSPALGRYMNHSAALRALVQTGFYFVQALELLAPLCLFSRRFRWVFVVGMGSFHLLTALTMNIFFWTNVALGVIFFDLDRLAERIGTARLH
ncbi:MAG: hypothetical protein GY716_07430 [bacterium]|nr:hypothetical protein [bacterium]